MLRIGERFLTHTAGPIPINRPHRSHHRRCARRRSPHPAAKRFVQEAFRIGFAMRKALSVRFQQASEWVALPPQR